jgi:hypothetical protein
MFRRRRQGPAAVRPRALKPRRPRASAEEAAGEFAFSTHIENGVRGLLGFLGGAALILWRFAASPHRFDRDADKTGRLSRDVPPYTFLTLATFAATSGFSALLTTAMLFWFELVREWADEAEEPPDVPTLGDLLRLPSAEDVITRGIPCVLLVMGVLGLVRLVLRRRSPEAAARFFRVGLYIAGFQYLLATLALALFVVGWVSRGGSLASRAHVGDVGVLLLPLVGAWPALLLALQLDKAWPLAARPSRAWRAARPLVIAAVALLTSVATFAPELAVSWAMASREVARQAQPRPLMDAAVVAYEHVDAPVPVERVTVLVTDRARRALHLVRGAAWLQRGVRDDDLAANARIVAWQGGNADVLAIEPGHAAWIVLQAATCPDAARADCGLKRTPQPPTPAESQAAAKRRESLENFRRWTFVDTAHPKPDLATGRVGFVEAQATGERGVAFAWLQGRLRP